MSAYRVSTTVTDAELARATLGLVAFSRTADGLLLSFRWLSRLAVPWLAGALLFGAALGWLWSASRAVTSHVIFFPVGVCALLAAAFGYVALAHLVNRTRVVIDRESLTVRHGPVPWPGGGTTRLADLAQIFVQREEHGTTKRSRSVDFVVRARTVGGDDVALVNGPLLPARALALEATLEAYLRIEDAPVDGSVRRR